MEAQSRVGVRATIAANANFALALAVMLIIGGLNAKVDPERALSLSLSLSPSHAHTSSEPNFNLVVHAS